MLCPVSRADQLHTCRHGSRHKRATHGIPTAVVVVEATSEVSFGSAPVIGSAPPNRSSCRECGTAPRTHT